jgi:hypothetical protein
LKICGETRCPLRGTVLHDLWFSNTEHRFSVA